MSLVAAQSWHQLKGDVEKCCPYGGTIKSSTDLNQRQRSVKDASIASIRKPPFPQRLRIFCSPRRQGDQDQLLKGVSVHFKIVAIRLMACNFIGGGRLSL